MTEHSEQDLQIIINKLQEFLINSSSSISTNDKFWDTWETSSPHKKINKCWEFKNCTKEACPVYKTDNKCWLTQGTLCTQISGKQVAITYQKQVRQCVECATINQLKDTKVQHLYELISMLIKLVKHRDKDLLILAITDALTGVYNRAYFEEFITKLVSTARRNKEEFSFIIIDIDDFKSINDSFGHLAGDEVLITVANSVKDTLRIGDLLFRYGGDEFLVILPKTDCDKVAVIKDRIADKLNNQEELKAKYPNIKLGVSVGCSTWSAISDVDIYDKIKEADLDMYSEKRSRK